MPVERKPQGLGLSRGSFGELKPQRVEKGYSLCNQNIGLGIDKMLKDGLSPFFDSPRNVTGNADETLAKEELVPYFPFVAVMGEPVVRVIHRGDDSIDFWFKDDAASDSYHAEQAAMEYCKSRDHRTALYVGFSYKCGGPVSAPIKVNGQQITVLHEERIVAYNCINPEISKISVRNSKLSPDTNSQKKETN